MRISARPVIVGIWDDAKSFQVFIIFFSIFFLWVISNFRMFVCIINIPVHICLFFSLLFPYLWLYGVFPLSCFICLFVSPYIYPSARYFVVNPSVCPFFRVFVRQSPSICLSVCLSIFRPFALQSVCPSLRTSIDPSVCASVCLFDDLSGHP